MFKRSIASCVAVAALSAAVVAPANAAEVKVEGDKCTVTFAPGEMKDTMPVIQVVSKADAKYTYLLYKEESKKAEAALAAKKKEGEKAVKPGDSASTDTVSVAELEKMVKASKTLAFAYKSCADGKDQSQLSSDAKVTLSAADETPSGAGIGVIVAGVVLGVVALVAAALPALAPMLPPQVRAMLNI